MFLKIKLWSNSVKNVWLIGWSKCWAPHLKESCVRGKAQQWVGDIFHPAIPGKVGKAGADEAAHILPPWYPSALVWSFVYGRDWHIMNYYSWRWKSEYVQWTLFTFNTDDRICRRWHKGLHVHIPFLRPNLLFAELSPVYTPLSVVTMEQIFDVTIVHEMPFKTT